MSDRSDAEENHCCTRDARDDGACGADFLDHNEDGQRRDPDQVHHTDYEEHAHQGPATAKAVDAVSNTVRPLSTLAST